ncbi:MAG: hypothetical protein ACM65L_03370 [Microcoleus sp.]
MLTTADRLTAADRLTTINDLSHHTLLKMKAYSIEENSLNDR